MLNLTLLGAFAVTCHGSAITDFPTDKVRALLAYLALEAEQPQRRERLAALLWPQQDHAGALYNLRLTLHRLRQTLDHAQPGVSEQLFIITRQSIQFTPTGQTAQVDALTFQRELLTSEAHTHAALHQCDSCLERLGRAVTRYRGELLAGFSLADAAPFEEWLLMRREALHLAALLTLGRLADAYEARQEYGPAQEYATRALALDPYREDLHRQIMRLLAQRGLAHQALVQYETCRRLLRDELGVAPAAETVTLLDEIRNGVYNKGGEERRARAGRAHESPVGGDGRGEATLKTQSLTHPFTDSPPHNLPAPTTPFIGRARELAELIALVQRPGVRLVTLVGAGGMGKSRLALEVGQTLRTTVADGVFFVALAGQAAPASVAPAIAAALGLELRGDLRRALCQALRTKQLLLILDNCEHLLPASAEQSAEMVELIAELVQSAPAVQLLATSRQRLNLRSEHLYTVEGLHFNHEATVAAASGSAAVRFFVQSVQRIQPPFTLTEANVPAVLRLCTLVQGMPLGLELAAAGADQLTPDEIALEVAKSLDFLTTEWRDLPARQRSMRAVFAWSWQLLSAVEQQVLRQLSVFRGGFTRIAAEAITSTSLRVLTSLTHKSLLHWQKTASAPGRYLLHELLRQFAAEQSALASAEKEYVAASHSEFYLHWVAQREHRLMCHDPRTAVAEIQGEIDNVRQAWEWAVRQQQIQTLDASAFALWQFYRLVSLNSEGAQRFQFAVESLRTLLAETDQGATTAQSSHLRLLSKLLAIYASFLVILSQNNQALTNAKQAVKLGEAHDSHAGETLGYLVWGQALRRKGQDLEAKHRLEYALELAHRYQSDDQVREALSEIASLAYGWLCSIALNPLHDYVAATAYAEQKLQLARRLGKRYAEIIGLSDLRDIAYAQGDYTGAQQYCEQVLHLAGQFGYRWLEANSQEFLGRIIQSQGEYERGYHLMEQAWAMFQQMGDLINEMNTLNALIRFSTLLGAYTQAQGWSAQLVRIVEIVEPPLGELLDGLLARTLLAHYTGAQQQALTYAEQSWPIAQQVADPLRLARVLVLMGHIQSNLRNYSAATTAYTQALAYYEQLRDPQRASEARAGLAQLALLQGDLAEGQRQVAIILPILTDTLRVGLDEPFLVYLTCYQVLAASNDPRAAAVLQQGYALLQQYASHIQDDALRRSFLENINVHRRLSEAFQRNMSGA
jgi:DNA-binding SARP family transcriptional activator/predicted ATPase